MKIKRTFTWLLCLTLILNAAICVPVSAATTARGVTSSFSVSALGNTFTVSRSSSGTVETVRYRTVGLSAIPGIHFTPAEGTLTFGVDDTSKSLSVTEKDISQVDVRYRYQSGTFREYSFEVLDPSGFLLAETTRRITYSSSYKFSNKYINSSVTDLIYLYLSSGSQSFRSNTTYYTDVTHSASSGTWITVKDPGYSQAVHTVPTSAIISKTGVSADYLSSVGDDMYVTVGFTETEVKDGYAYIQILADNDSTYDGDDSDGTVSTPSKSLYKACFEMDDTNTANTDSYKMYFPHRYDHKNRSEGGQSASWTEFPLSASYLYKQAFKNTSYRAGSSGSIVVSPTVENINVRFDAAGKDADDWKFKDMFIRLAIADTKAPTLLDIGAPNNCIAKGNRVTLNLLFSEIVDAAGTVLHTTWGDLSVRQNSDSLSNIVSYSGFITADAGTQLRVTGLDGNVKDLIGNKLTGAVTRTLTPTVAGYTAPPASGGVYSLSCLSDLYWFAEKVNTQSNVSAILTSDITVPTAYVPEFAAIGGTGGYDGTFDGNGHTIRNLTNVTSSAGYLGLFTKIGRTGTVRGVRLENASVGAPETATIGGICGQNSGTVEDCSISGRVSNLYSSDNGSGSAIGCICGENIGTVRNCSAVNTDNTIIILNRWRNMTVGGIVGRNSGTALGCMFYGRYSENSSNITRGAICGLNNGTVANCVGLHDNSNYFSGVIGGGSGTSENNMFPDAGTAFTDGEVCYTLNGGVTDGSQAWYQTLGTDALPAKSGETVYLHGGVYTNSSGHTFMINRCNWSEGFLSATFELECSLCGETAVVPATVTSKLFDDTFVVRASATYGDRDLITTVRINIFYEVEFYNDDNVLLQTVRTPAGMFPEYSGTPQKASDDQNDYEFAGWDPPLHVAVCTDLYKACFTPIPKVYTVSFYDYDGTHIKTDTYHYYETADPPTAPVRPGDETTSYKFTGWYDEDGNFVASDPFIVTGDTELYAGYEAKTAEYTVNFVNQDGTVLCTQDCSYGDMPVYGGDAPTMSRPGCYSYSFSGWIPELAPVTEDATYVANFSATYGGLTPVRQCGDYKYILDQSHSAEIVGYSGTDTHLTIPDYLDGYRVVKIGENAFRGNSFIRSVVIPDTVEEIGDRAFYGCTSLTEAEIDEGMDFIGAEAFRYCISLTTLRIKSVFSYDSDAFSDTGDMTVYGPHSLRGCELTNEYTFIGTDGHDNISWYWTSDPDAAYLIVRCSGCDFEGEDVTAELSERIITPPTCTEDGEREITATASFDGRVYTDTQTYSEAATGHDWGEPVWSWNGYSTAMAVFTCKHDSDHIDVKPAFVESTTTSMGYVYTARVTGPDGKSYTDRKSNFSMLDMGKNTVDIPDDGLGGITLMFVPPSSGRYRFYSEGPYDTEIEVYKGAYEVATDPDSGEYYNFDVFCDLEKGVEYAVHLLSYDGDITANVFVENTIIRDITCLQDNLSCRGTVNLFNASHIRNGAACVAAYDIDGTLADINFIRMRGASNYTLAVDLHSEYDIACISLMLFEDYALLKPLTKQVYIYSSFDDPGDDPMNDDPHDDPEDPPEDPPEDDPPEDDFPPDDE